MKIGMRTPSIKSSIKARTTGRMKKAAKSAVNPLHGKEGVGLIKDPKKSIEGRIYKRTTFGLGDVLDKLSGKE